MTLKDRIKIYCTRKNIPISGFERKSGLSNGYFNQVSKRPSSKKIDNISTAFPDLNIDWLLTGEGEMLKTDTTNQPESQPKQLEFDFNRWMENEEKKTAYLQKLITTNSQLSSTNSELVEMLKEAISKSGKGEFQNQIDELSRRIDRFLESWSQKRAEDAI
jgi:hypothetical protein